MTNEPPASPASPASPVRDRGRFANVAAALVATGLVVFVHSGPHVLGLPARREPTATIHSDVKDLVLAGYVVDVDPKTLDYKALKGMISGLDPYSAFLTPEEAWVIVETFLATPMTEARYIARLTKVDRLERR